MYIIRDLQTGLLFHKKQQIILFERQEEAQIFLQSFMKYSIQRLLEETHDPTVFFQVQTRLSQCQIIEPSFNIESVETVWFHELT